MGMEQELFAGVIRFGLVDPEYLGALGMKRSLAYQIIDRASGQEGRIELKQRLGPEIFSNLKCKTPILDLRTGFHLSTRLIRVIVIQRRESERLRCKTNCFDNSFLQWMTSIKVCYR